MSEMAETLFGTPAQQAYAFGRRLREARLAAGYGSQTALARRMALHPLTVHRHEMQGMVPKREVVDQYCWLLGVSPQWLLYGSNDPMLDLPGPVKEYLLGPFGRSLDREVFTRMQRVPWGVIADLDTLQREQVHEVARLIERNLAMRASSRGAEQLSLQDIPPPRPAAPAFPAPPRRQALAAR